MTVEILHRETVYTFGSNTLQRKTAKMPDGTTVEKTSASHADSVGVVPLLEDGQVVLVRQYRLPLEDFLLEIPAGGTEPGEAPPDAARRELQEEAGYYPGSLHPLGGFYLAPGLSDEYMHLFLARALTPSTRPGDPDEFISVQTMPLDQAFAAVQAGDIQDAKTISGLYQAVAALRG